jgi:RING finger protein 121
MHAQMLMILVVTVLVAQVVLVEWRERHLRSYQVGLNGSNNGRFS